MRPIAIFAANPYHDGIVFAVARVRKPELPQSRHVKGTWCTEAMNAKHIVVAVLRRPFAVIDQPGRN